MPTFQVSAGFRIDHTTVSRYTSEGISNFTGNVVRILRIDSYVTDTIFTIETDSESNAVAWKNAIINDLGYVVPFEIPAVENPDPDPDPLDVWSQVGQWTKSIGNATTTISSLPGTPKGVIIWGSGLSGAAHGTYNDAGGVVIGFSDGTTHRDLGFVSQDNVATSNSNTATLARAFHMVDPTGTGPTHFTEGCTIGFNADSFDMDWIDGTTLATVGHYMVFGGDDIGNVLVKDFQNDTLAAGIHEYTGLGGRYDFGLFLKPFISGASSPLNANIGVHSVSAHAGDATSHTWVSTIRHQDNVNPSSTHRLQRKNRLLVTMGTTLTAQQQAATWKEWTDDGFIVDWVNPPNTTTGHFAGFFVQGGKWDAGYLTQPTSTGTVRSLLTDKYSVIQALMGFSIGQSDISSQTSGNIVAKMMIGAEDVNANRGCLTYSSTHNSSPTAEATIMVTDRFIKNINADPTASSSITTAEATVSDIATRGEFTTDFTTVDTIPRQTVWFSLSA